MNSIDPHEAINYMIKNAKAYAQAKAEVTYLEQYRKSKKAILFASAMGNTIADKESYAYSHPEYLDDPGLLYHNDDYFKHYSSDPKTYVKNFRKYRWVEF